MSEQRRFPPPWSVDDPDMKLGQDCYIVRDANGYPQRTGTGNQLRRRRQSGEDHSRRARHRERRRRQLLLPEGMADRP